MLRVKLRKFFWFLIFHQARQPTIANVPTHTPKQKNTHTHTQGVLELHAERLDDSAEDREELWKAIESLRLAEPSDITGFTEIDRAHLTFGSGMPLVSGVPWGD